MTPAQRIKLEARRFALAEAIRGTRIYLTRLREELEVVDAALDAGEEE